MLSLAEGIVTVFVDNAKKVSSENDNIKESRIKSLFLYEIVNVFFNLFTPL